MGPGGPRGEPGADLAAVAQSLNQLATLYYDLGRFAEAEPLLRRAVEAQDKAARPDPLEQARSQTLMGLLLVAQRRYAEAEPHFLKAIALREKAQGPRTPRPPTPSTTWPGPTTSRARTTRPGPSSSGP